MLSNFDIINVLEDIEICNNVLVEVLHMQMHNYIIIIWLWSASSLLRDLLLYRTHAYCKCIDGQTIFIYTYTCDPLLEIESLLKMK